MGALVVRARVSPPRGRHRPWSSCGRSDAAAARCASRRGCSSFEAVQPRRYAPLLAERAAAPWEGATPPGPSRASPHVGDRATVMNYDVGGVGRTTSERVHACLHLDWSSVGVSVLRTSELPRHTRRVHGIAMVRYRLPVRGRASVYWLVYMPRSKRAGCASAPARRTTDEELRSPSTHRRH